MYVVLITRLDLAFRGSSFQYSRRFIFGFFTLLGVYAITWLVLNAWMMGGRLEPAGHLQMCVLHVHVTLIGMSCLLTALRTFIATS